MSNGTQTETSPAPEVAWSQTDLLADPHAAPDKAQRVRKMFAAIANRYDLNNRVHSLGRDQAWRRRAAALCEVRPTDDVLDVACGTGDLTQAFAKCGPRSVTGVDFTLEMLELARLKVQRQAGVVATAITYIQGDAMALPFADESFDVVSIAFGIRNVADPARALREFRRVLRKDGRLVVLEFSRPPNPIMRFLNDAYCGYVMPMTATIIAADRSGAYRYLPKSVATFPDSQQFIDMLKDADFAPVSAHPMTFGICTAYLAHRR